jgi:hypothetical protein
VLKVHRVNHTTGTGLPTVAANSIHHVHNVHMLHPSYLLYM